MTNLARSFVLVCIIFFILLFLSYRLGFLDEDNWVTNGRLFFQALKSFNLSSTYIGSDAQHPGVSILWLSILSQVITQKFPGLQIYPLHSFFVLMVFFASLVISGKILLRSIPAKALFISVVYLLLQPYLLITGKSTWLDLVLTGLFILTISIWMKFLEANKKRNLYISGILIGVAGLTKFLGFILILMIFAISLFYIRKKRVRLNFVLNSLLTVGIIAILTFYILYPAMWVNPQRALFSRFDPGEGSQKITLVKNGNIYLEFAKQIIFVDPLIIVSLVIITYYLFTKKDFEVLDFLALAGLVYFVSLSVIIFVLYDKGRGIHAFLAGFNRYTLPLIPLIAPFFFKTVIGWKEISRQLKFAFIGAVFIWEISNFPLTVNIMLSCFSFVRYMH